MIKCKYYKAEFQETTTCIKKQIRCHELLERKDVIKARSKKGMAAIRNAVIASEYYSLLGCFDCKTGKKLYNQWKKENKDKKISKQRNFATWGHKEKPIDIYIRNRPKMLREEF